MENNEFYTLLGKNISSIRNKKGYKQEDLANYLGLSRPSLVNIEKGNQKPSIFVVLSIAQYLNVNALELLPELPENNFESIRIVGLDVDKSILSRDSSLRDFLQTI
ncbi:helix-turn-helix domain-containing protein [Epilithonimonas sp. JDS]|uniref:helix-turn-helix domain-containing protein n=1 Tax=Epilithonimonas sp. JDS TaxID=2902797 RepID=UPI001E3BB5DC|nr:helix-turn-helix transcriptional regulator [Epilithonimonas sp. JDS]MCD9853840.1 helix-turn-helix domain-containing protein [Epilithonimonas sp. JDS]